MNDDQYKILIEELRGLKKRLDDIEMGLSKDREHIQDLTIGLENVKTEITTTRQAVNRSSERVKNAVADVAEPIVGAAMDLTTEIKKKKMFVLKQNSWWYNLLRKFK